MVGALVAAELVEKTAINEAAAMLAISFQEADAASAAAPESTWCGPRRPA
jgi:hypothetical protein